MPKILIFEDTETESITKIFIDDEPKHYTKGYLAGKSRMSYYSCSGNKTKGFKKGVLRGTYDYKLLKKEATISNKKKCAICKYYTACQLPKGNSSSHIRSGIMLSMMKDFECALKEQLIEKNKSAIEYKSKKLLEVIKVEKTEGTIDLYKPIELQTQIEMC